jgi:D-3-phosphoglycerate dehydrogenase
MFLNKGKSAEVGRNSLFTLENLIVTPHISFYSEESYVELKTKTAEAVLAVLKGERPRSVVNPQVLKS